MYAIFEFPRCSYAASVGSDHVPEKYREEMIRLLRKYDAISTFVKTEPYLLVYSVERGRKPLVSEVASRVAAERGLKVYFVTPRWFSSSVRCDRKFNFSTPLEFLALFLNADFAVVSSFHGTAFSVNLIIPFVSVVPDRFNSRIASLLELTELQNRMVTNIDAALEGADSDVDWNGVNERLNNERSRSGGFVKEAIFC